MHLCVLLVGMRKRQSVHLKAEGLCPAACTHTRTHRLIHSVQEGSWEAARLFTAVGKIAKSGHNTYGADSMLELPILFALSTNRATANDLNVTLLK